MFFVTKIYLVCFSSFCNSSIAIRYKEMYMSCSHDFKYLHWKKALDRVMAGSSRSYGCWWAAVCTDVSLMVVGGLLCVLM